jgi:hypothetical protein
MKMPTKKTKPAESKKPRSRVSSAREKKAFTLMRQWSVEHIQMNYIDKGSGLRHPGFIVDTSDDDFPSFEFSGYGGISATILPLGWINLDVQTVAGFESVHIEEQGGKSFGLAPVFVPRSRATDLECAKAQLLMWRTSGTVLHFFLSQGSLSFAFGGTIANMTSAGFSVEIQGTRILLVMGFENLTYKVGRDGGGIKIEAINRNTGTHVTVSEIEPAPEALLGSLMIN